MSNYPLWWDTTITVFSKCVSPTAIVTWHKAVINSCFWKNVGAKVNIGEVVLDTEHIVCRIPQQGNFIAPTDWISRSEDTLDGYFTLQPGDIIIKGNCDAEIDEYKSGQRSTDLISKYRKIQGCMEIKEVAIDTMTGMMNPHYNVRGL